MWLSLLFASWIGPFLPTPAPDRSCDLRVVRVIYRSSEGAPAALTRVKAEIKAAEVEYSKSGRATFLLVLERDGELYRRMRSSEEPPDSPFEELSPDNITFAIIRELNRSYHVKK